MAYKVDGKIACQFSWGAVNYDVKKVIVLDAMHPTSGASDERYAANKIYYIPAGVTPASFNDLQQYRIWHRYWESPIVRQLVAGDKNVAIEYTPAANIIISGIEIFTSQDSSNTNGRVKIIHESGLYVGSVNGDAKDGSTELYGLTGWKRYVNNAGIQLYGGKKYFIVFNDDNPVNAYYPAYFQAETGNYKEYSNDRDSVTISDVSGLGSYLGILSSFDTVIAASENACFTWNSSGSGSGLNNNVLYVRNSLLSGSTYYGTLGGAHNITNEEKDAILSMTSGTSFYWDGWVVNAHSTQSHVLEQSQIHQKNSTLDQTKYKGMKNTEKGILDDLGVNDYAVYNGTSTNILSNGSIYRKKKHVKVDVELEFTHDQSSLDTAYLIDASCDSITNKTVAPQGQLWYTSRTGNIYTLKSSYHAVDFNKDSQGVIQGYDPTTITSLAAGTFIYFYTSGNCPLINSWVGTYVYYWDGSSLSIVGQNEWESYFDIVSLSDAIEEMYLDGCVDIIGQVSTLVKASYSGDGVVTNTLVSAETKHDRKYYVKLTDSNNNSFEV